MELFKGIGRISTRSIGDFVFDMTLSETHSSKLNITENPIETGESVADHAYMAPKEVTITGLMVDYEPPSSFMDDVLSPLEIGFDLSLPVDISAITYQARKLADKVLLVKTKIEQAQRIIAPFLPNFDGEGKDTSNTLNRIGRAYSDLDALQKSVELLEVKAGIYHYKNMALASITSVQTKDGASEFTLFLREVFIVSTQKASGLVDSTKTTGRTSTQTSPKTNQGNTNQSLIKIGMERIGGLFK